MQRVRIGLIGAGRIGAVHAQSIIQHVEAAELAAVADVNLEAAEALGRRYGVPLVSADYRQLLDEPGIDAVAICSATATHSPIIQDAAAAGKHIFCEKPLDLDLARIDAALAAVAAGGVKLQVGFNRRFDASFGRLRQLVAAGELGRPHLLRITSRDPAPPPLEYVTTSGGLFLDMTIHDFDMARFLMGSEVERVYAVGRVLVDPAIGAAGDIDTAAISLEFSDGGLGLIDNSRQAVYGYDQRAEVFGSEGMAAAENLTPDAVTRADGRGVHSAKPLYFFLERYLPAYVAEMRAFVGALAEDRPPPVGGRDGRQAVALALAAGRSLREGRPVRVAEVEEPASSASP
ncbi:MAG: inositol 2-dehydrogenase [Candidatus Promineifilaceae bacterium]